jgi:hypothetical protein
MEEGPQRVFDSRARLLQECTKQLDHPLLAGGSQLCPDIRRKEASLLSHQTWKN